MRCPGPASDHGPFVRFQCTMCQPPLPSPRSTAVVLMTIRSPTPTGPVSWVSAYARSPPTRDTRVRPRRLDRTADTSASRNAGTAKGLQRRDQLLDPLVVGLERVLAQHGALGLIVELQVHPVDRVVALALLGPADELTAQASSRGLRRQVHRGVDVGVGAHPLDQVVVLQLVVEAPRAVHVVV